MEKFKIKAFDKVHGKIRDVAAVHLIEQAVLLWIDSGNVRATVARDMNDVNFIRRTGLKDKNDTEIDEGAIYHMGDPKITYTVVWHDTGLIGKQNGSSSYAGISSWQERIEVIGNSYENPELLTERS